jgi:magnesium transporter
MAFLTVLSSVFLPLTFIVGLYGMNFKTMPELEWRYGYLFVWVLMLTITIGIIVWFKRKKIF